MKYVLGLLFSKDLTQVLLIVKERPAWQKGLANGIGGKIEPGENPLQAMVREAKEEANLDGVTWNPYMTLTGHNEDYGSWHVTCFTAVAEDIHDHCTMTDEHLIVWDANRLPTNIVPHLDMNVRMARLSMNTNLFARITYT